MLATEMVSRSACFSLGETHIVSSCTRFPNLFPPLKPETVARRTVEAVQLNQALLLLPWTMHALIILKRYGLGEKVLGHVHAGCFPSRW